MLYERTHTRLIKNLGGIFRRMPIFSAFFFITLLSSIALPGTNGFVGEFLILLGAFQRNKPLAAIAALGMILSACYMLWMYQRVFLGTLSTKDVSHLKDLSLREILVLLPLIGLILWIGIYPTPILNAIETIPIAAMVSIISGGKM